MLTFYLTLIDTKEEKSKFVRLYEKYGRLMFYIANKILKNQQDAEDAVGEAFIKIIDILDKIVDIECHKTKSLIVIIVRNHSINIYNQNIRRSTVPLSVLENIAFSDTMNYGGEDSLRNEILQLPSTQRDVLSLKYIYGYSNEEIARMLDITEATLRKRLQRARELLRDKMQEDEEATIL